MIEVKRPGQKSVQKATKTSRFIFSLQNFKKVVLVVKKFQLAKNLTHCVSSVPIRDASELLQTQLF